MARRRKRRLCIANTHIFWDPEYADVKLWQSWVLAQELEKLVINRNLPLVLCGDFNSMTDSAVYEFLSSSRLNTHHRVFNNDPCQLLVGSQCSCDVHLCSFLCCYVVSASALMTLIHVVFTLRT
jgi:mRNA deadenylase 3'-5' endonuclease subunit Ccr4